MTTKEQTKTEFKFKELEEYFKLLKNNGFKIYTSCDNPITYFHFVKDNNIGYVQYSLFEGFKFSSVHKPNRETGTGFQIEEKEIHNPTIKDALNCFVVVPDWWRGNKPIKYSNWEEYEKSEIVLKQREVL